MAIGSPVLAAPLASVTCSNEASTVAPQSASTAPAAVWMPPSRCWTNAGSVYDSSVWPPPVYQDRPPSYSWHQAIGWSAPMAPDPGEYEDSSRLASTWTWPRGFSR